MAWESSERVSLLAIVGDRGGLNAPPFTCERRSDTSVVLNKNPAERGVDVVGEPPGFSHGSAAARPDCRRHSDIGQVVFRLMTSRSWRPKGVRSPLPARGLLLGGLEAEAAAPIRLAEHGAQAPQQHDNSKSKHAGRDRTLEKDHVAPA